MLIIFPVNFLIKFFDRTFINPARQINLIFFLNKIFKDFFSPSPISLKLKIFFSILFCEAYFKPFAYLLFEITKLIVIGDFLNF